MKLYGANETRR